MLIAGGGVAGLEATLALRQLAPDHVIVELLAPEPHFWYRPLSVAEPFKLGKAVRYELDGVTRSIGATFTPGALTGIDAWRHIAFTSKNVEIPYDVLVLACGALPVPVISGAVTFRGPADTEKVERVLKEVRRGEVRSLVLAIPQGPVWSLPAYELALLASTHLWEARVYDVQLTLVTPEAEPLQVFGPAASEAVRELFDSRGIELWTASFCRELVDGTLELFPKGQLEADRVVALPRLQGAPIDGLPQTIEGFIPIDAHCRVHGVADVYAAGDITSFPIKQGGIAAQQGDAAAQMIAADTGADVTPEPFRPVLRGLLLTGRQPRYLRREVTGQPERQPAAAREPLWWPPAKIVGRYLAPFLASLAGGESPIEMAEPSPGTLRVQVEVDPQDTGAIAPARFGLESKVESDAPRVEQLMSTDPIVAAPEDTIGEVGERMVQRGERAACVAEYGRLIGIVTTSDLVRVAAARAHPSEARVRHWMTAEPVTVRPSDAASAAELLMREYGVHHLPVVEGEQAVGMFHAVASIATDEATHAPL